PTGLSAGDRQLGGAIVHGLTRLQLVETVEDHDLARLQAVLDLDVAAFDQAREDRTLLGLTGTALAAAAARTTTGLTASGRIGRRRVGRRGSRSIRGSAAATGFVDTTVGGVEDG